MNKSSVRVFFCSQRSTRQDKEPIISTTFKVLPVLDRKNSSTFGSQLQLPTTHEVSATSRRQAVLPRFAVGDFELGTETRHKHVVVDDQFGDGGRRQRDRDADHAEQWRKLFHRRRRKRHLRSQVRHDLNDLPIASIIIIVTYTTWPEKVSHYQIIKKIVLNRINARQ